MLSTTATTKTRQGREALALRLRALAKRASIAAVVGGGLLAASAAGRSAVVADAVVAAAVIVVVVVAGADVDAGLLGGRGELDADAVLEDDGLVLVGDGGVHDRAVTVPLHVGLVALVGAAPSHEAHLPAGEDPVAVAIEGLPEPGDEVGGDQVDEGIAEGSTSLEVNGQVHEVVLACEALAVEHGEQHVASVVVGQVSQHDGGSLRDRDIGDVVLIVHAALRFHASLHVQRDELLVILVATCSAFLTRGIAFGGDLGVRSVVHVDVAAVPLGELHEVLLLVELLMLLGAAALALLLLGDGLVLDGTGSGPGVVSRVGASLYWHLHHLHAHLAHLPHLAPASSLHHIGSHEAHRNPDESLLLLVAHLLHLHHRHHLGLVLVHLSPHVAVHIGLRGLDFLHLGSAAGLQVLILRHQASILGHQLLHVQRSRISSGQEVTMVAA
mmetsp:Transcript_40068/g.85874  ORF Transcript_40068/g.85874 Transcript_40068/m.85874 type:complete len:442 (-) Transcript_40068:446-1771(-)